MEIQNIEIAPMLKGILLEFDIALKKREEFDLGFNIFSLVSDQYYKENFHSEIIHAFLDTKGKHNENRLFLDLFLNFLIPECKIKIPIDKANYDNGLMVCNEHTTDGLRRIDILICSDSHAIIIENKIYNAIDMDNQLIDYYKYCKETKKLKVDAIIYLSIDGKKIPDKNKWECNPETKLEIEQKLIKMAAFDIGASGKSLYHWLDKCESKSEVEENQFIIRQYKQLLKFLRGYIMETEALKDYYEWISNPENKDKATEIEKWIKIHNELIRYYPVKLIEEIDKDDKRISWYSESKTWGDTEVIFDGIGNDKNYYLKVTFYTNKFCKILIQDNTKGNPLLDEKLKKNNTFSELFKYDGERWNLLKTDYDLILHFDYLVEEVKEILMLFSDIARIK